MKTIKNFINEKFDFKRDILEDAKPLNDINIGDEIYYCYYNGTKKSNILSGKITNIEKRHPKFKVADNEMTIQVGREQIDINFNDGYPIYFGWYQMLNIDYTCIISTDYDTLALFLKEYGKNWNKSNIDRFLK